MSNRMDSWNTQPPLPGTKAPETLNSRTYIAKFERLDRDPAPDGTPEREAQIIKLCKRIAGEILKKASPDQILTQHRMFMSGLMG